MAEKMRNHGSVEVKWRRPRTLNEAARLVDTANERVAKWVKASRIRGATWEQVAVALGITRQAAWSRFHGQCSGIVKQPEQRLLAGALSTLELRGFRVKQADKWIRELVRIARANGQSWDEIARELGVRRQTAWERYGTASKPATDVHASVPTGIRTEGHRGTLPASLESGLSAVVC